MALEHEEDDDGANRTDARCRNGIFYSTRAFRVYREPGTKGKEEHSRIVREGKDRNNRSRSDFAENGELYRTLHSIE